MHAIYIYSDTYTKMNLSTVKWAQWDKTQTRKLLGLFICVCIALCTIVVHNTAHNRPDNFPSYLQAISIAPMMSIWGKEKMSWLWNSEIGSSVIVISFSAHALQLFIARHSSVTKLTTEKAAKSYSSHKTTLMASTMLFKTNSKRAAITVFVGNSRLHVA